MPSAVSKAVFGGRYQATPVTLSDGSVGYILLDSEGRIVTYIGRYQETPATLANLDFTPPLTDAQGRLHALIDAICPEGETRTMELMHTVPAIGTAAYSLRTAHPRGLKAVSVCDPGLAYANGANSLCLAAPSIEANELEIENIYLSAKTTGDFYLCCRNLGIAPGATTNYTFDLVGIKGDDITSTTDVLWATFLGATGKGLTGGDFHFDLGMGCELYLIAPDITYNLIVAYVEESM